MSLDLAPRPDAGDTPVPATPVAEPTMPDPVAEPTMPDPVEPVVVHPPPSGSPPGAGSRRRRHRHRRFTLPALAVRALLAVVGLGLAGALWPASLGGEIGYSIVTGESMEPGLHQGDLVLTRPKDRYRPGDVIAYRIPDGEPGAGVMVIHRVVGGADATGYVTLGDNRAHPDQWHPTGDDIVGARWVLVPRGGLAILWLRSPLGIAAVGGLVVFLAALGAEPGRSAERRPRRA